MAAVSVLVVLLGGAMVATTLDEGSRSSNGLPDRPADAADTRLSPVVESVGTGGFAFIETQDGGGPVTYDPCVPIHLVVDPRTIVDGGMEILDQAVEEVRAATGLVFMVDGLTEQPASAEQTLTTPDRPGWSPVRVVWSDPEESDKLVGDTAGFAGSIFVERDKHRWFVTGSVVLDGPQLTKILNRDRKGRAAVRAVLMHELGHLIGLDHVDAPGQLMQPKSDGSSTGWGRGDRAGLAKVGAGPCIKW